MLLLIIFNINLLKHTEFDIQYHIIILLYFIYVLKLLFFVIIILNVDEYFLITLIMHFVYLNILCC
jgi:hypothetical protein